MQAAIPERPRLPALTSVRFLAAVWVAFFHMGAMHAFTLPTAALQRVASVGYSGVSFFFVLSGFILVYTYSGRETRPVIFWRARFARVYPALAFSLLVTAPGFFYCCVQMRAHNPQVVIPEWTWSAAHTGLASALSVLLLQSWVPQAALAWNMPCWSLSAEAFFYLVFPFLLPRLVRLSRRQLLAIAPVGWLLALACTLGYLHVQPDGIVSTKTVGTWINFIKFSPLMHLPEFLMGMAAAVLFLRREGSQRPGWPLVLAGLAGVLAVIVCSKWIPYVVIHTALPAPAYAVLIYGLALRPKGLGVLESSVAEALGEASYPFYLLHSLVIGAFFLDYKTGTAKHQSVAGLLMWLLLAVGVAVLVDRLIERPLRRVLRPRRKLLEAAAVSA